MGKRHVYKELKMKGGLMELSYDYDFSNARIRILDEKKKALTPEMVIPDPKSARMLQTEFDAFTYGMFRARGNEEEFLKDFQHQITKKETFDSELSQIDFDSLNNSPESSQELRLARIEEALGLLAKKPLEDLQSLSKEKKKKKSIYSGIFGREKSDDGVVTEQKKRNNRQGFNARQAVAIIAIILLFLVLAYSQGWITIPGASV